MGFYIKFAALYELCAAPPLEPRTLPLDPFVTSP